MHVNWGEWRSGYSQEKLDEGSVPKCTSSVDFPQVWLAVMLFYQRSLRWESWGLKAFWRHIQILAIWKKKTVFNLGEENYQIKVEMFN